jgi:hypothetical protein
MARTLRAFAPIQNLSQVYAASAVAQSSTWTITVPYQAGNTFLQGSSAVFPNNLIVDNQTDKSVFVKSGVGAQTAATTDVEVKAGTLITIDIGAFADTTNVLPQAACTGTVYLKRGLGGI